MLEKIIFQGYFLSVLLISFTIFYFDFHRSYQNIMQIVTVEKKNILRYYSSHLLVQYFFKNLLVICLKAYLCGVPFLWFHHSASVSKRYHQYLCVHDENLQKVLNSGNNYILFLLSQKNKSVTSSERKINGFLLYQELA